MIKTFPRGGVHPPENKITAGVAIEKTALPSKVCIPVSQHLGAPATVLVQKGDYVKVGQLIAGSNGFVSANIHASVSGKVSKIEEMLDSSGYKRLAIQIDREGDEWLEGIDADTEVKTSITDSREEIVRKVAAAGIVGMGGATFPTHIKLSVPPGKKAEYLIINGVECEPYLTSDHRLMMERPYEMLVGIKLLMKALDVQQAIIGIENNKQDAIELLSQICIQENGIRVQALKVQYPQGGEKQLIKALINREVPSGGLPIDVGVVVHNVGTAVAVYEAVQKNKPLIERVVTLTGKSVVRPGNYLVRIGTAIEELVAISGGLPEDTGKIINGGPMMGKAITSLEAPVTKGTSGIVIISEEEASRKPVANCIRCARCTIACPMGLEPYLLMGLSGLENWEKAEKKSVMDCIECGSCSYICPSNRPILDYIRLGKYETGKIIKNRRQS